MALLVSIMTLQLVSIIGPSFNIFKNTVIDNS